MVLLRKNNDDPADEEHYNNFIPVIRAAILGSILANVLLCMGFCFFAGGMRREEQEFDAAISEVGSGLLLTAGFGLMIPAAFFTSLSGSTSVELDAEGLTDKVLTISRVTSVILFVAFLLYVWFQMRTHHSIYDAVLEKDEAKDHDRHKDLKKAKLTLTECILALVIAITFVCLHAVFLVEEIEYVVLERGVSDSFMGLILVPLVEKAAEHLTAVDEAWDNQMNFALAHVLGATIQTALFNGPLVVIVGWGLHKAMVSGQASIQLLWLTRSGSEFRNLQRCHPHPRYHRGWKLPARRQVQLPRGCFVHSHIHHHRCSILLLSKPTPWSCWY